MSLTRIATAAALAAAAFAPATAVASPENCVTHPENCYVCVMYPCYPQDYPPFLIDTVTGLLPPRA